MNNKMEETILSVRNRKFSGHDKKYPRLLAEEAVASVNNAHNLSFPTFCQEMNYANFLAIRDFLESEGHTNLVKMLDREFIGCCYFVRVKCKVKWNKLTKIARERGYV